MSPYDALRPIVLGRGTSSPGEPANEVRRPKLALGVVPGGTLLGYVLIERTHPEPLGGLTTTPGLTLDVAQTLMTSTAMQLSLFGVPRPGHHCALIVEADSVPAEIRSRLKRFLEALRPLTENGVCMIAYTRGTTDMTPPLACRGLAATAAAATLAALEHAKIPVNGATLALHQAGAPARLVAKELVRRGMQQIADGHQALRIGADVLIVDGPVWRIDPRHAQTIRARVVVSLGPLHGSRAALDRIATRTVVVMPDTIAGAGSLIAVHLAAAGLTEDAAVAECFSRVRALATDALERAGGRDLVDFVRSLGREALQRAVTRTEP